MGSEPSEPPGFPSGRCFYGEPQERDGPCLAPWQAAPPRPAAPAVAPLPSSLVALPAPWLLRWAQRPCPSCSFLPLGPQVTLRRQLEPAKLAHGFPGLVRCAASQNACVLARELCQHRKSDKRHRFHAPQGSHEPAGKQFAARRLRSSSGWDPRLIPRTRPEVADLHSRLLTFGPVSSAPSHADQERGGPLGQREGLPPLESALPWARPGRTAREE